MDKTKRNVSFLNTLDKYIRGNHEGVGQILDRPTPKALYKLDHLTLSGVKISSNLGLTLTLNTKKISHDISPYQQYKEFLKWFLKYIQKLYRKDPNIQLVLYPELTIQGVIHFHGFLQTSDTFHASFINSHRRNIGKAHVSPLKTDKDREQYLTYSKKNFTDMLQIRIVPLYLTQTIDENNRPIIYTNIPITI